MHDPMRVTRRRFLCGLPMIVIPSAWSQAIATEPPPHRSAAKGMLRRELLSGVSTWGCQFQNIDLDRIAASDLDLIVVDHALGQPERVVADAEDIERLKMRPDGRRRLVLAYLSVGEAEDYRPYWKSAWKRQPPGWLGPVNPAWPGAYNVRYWDDEWKDITYRGQGSILRAILGAGFDGAFLDRVDGYADWERERPAASNEMIELVSELADVARAGTPEFIIISQNAEPLLRVAEFRNVIDGVSKESLLYGLQGQETANTKSDVAWSLAGLNAAHRDGIPVLAIEYLQDPRKIEAAREELSRLGFVAFFANRALDRVPGG